MPSITVDLQFQRENFALDTKFELDNSNQITVILGPSGCGKSTLLRLLAGLESADSGYIRCNDEHWFNAAKRINFTPQKRSTGFVFQDYALFENMTVQENIGFGVDRKNRGSMVEQMLATMNLREYKDKFPFELSGGQKQRVALGRALAIKPKLLLLDEPLSAIDFQLRKQLQKELKTYIRAQQCPVLLVTHDLQEARFMADRLIVMSQGKISRQGAASIVFDNPVNRDTATVLGWQNFLPIETLSKGTVSTMWGDFVLDTRFIPNASWIGIRPEHIFFSKTSNNCIKATVTEVIDMGLYREYTCDVGKDVKLIVQRPIAEPAPSEGAVVNLHLSSNHLRYINNSYRFPNCIDSQVKNADLRCRQA